VKSAVPPNECFTNPSSRGSTCYVNAARRPRMVTW
jgi:hypothetical protein